MARLARVVVPGLPHHITQRGNRGQATYFCDEDYQCYLELMGQWCSAHQVEIWAYCLMPNHVHLIAVPRSADGLRRAIGEVHRRYTRMVNLREGWRGHLWQGRFASFVLDKPYLLTAARYVELNPVRAGLVKAPTRYRWSSAAAHARRRDDALVRVAPLLKLAPPWRGFLARVIREEDLKVLRAHERTGRPLGDEEFVTTVEQKLGRTLKRQKPGPKPKRRRISQRQKPGPKPKGRRISQRYKPRPKPPPRK
jgi:putative transposase